LAALLARVPGSRAVALVDSEGETVDYAGPIDPFEIRVVAAHWRIVLDRASGEPQLRRLERLAVRAARRSFLVHVLPDGYALVLVLARGAGLFGWAGASRALPACARALGSEAGWTWEHTAAPPAWFPLDIVADERHRPVAARVQGEIRRLEILGAVAGSMGRSDRGWRVRFDWGVEALLVREPGGMWYADEPPAPPDGFGRGGGSIPLRSLVRIVSQEKKR
jgi:hypothetical protein